MSSTASPPRLAFAALPVLSLVAVAAPDAAPSTSPAGAASEAASVDALDAHRLAARACYARRSRPDQARCALEQAQAAQALAPDDVEANILVAMAAGHLASDLEPGVAKSRLGALGYQAAQRVVARAPARVEGHYFCALDLGLYAEGIGVLRALREGIKGRLDAHLDAALRIDPHYQQCAPLIARARMLIALPWPLRDVDAARGLMSEVRTACPRSPRADLFDADVAILEGRPAEARAVLATMLRTLPDAAADREDGAVVRRWAEQRLAGLR